MSNKKRRRHHIRPLKVAEFRSGERNDPYKKYLESTSEHRQRFSQLLAGIEKRHRSLVMAKRNRNFSEETFSGSSVQLQDIKSIFRHINSFLNALDLPQYNICISLALNSVINFCLVPNKVPIIVT